MTATSESTSGTLEADPVCVSVVPCAAGGSDGFVMETAVVEMPAAESTREIRSAERAESLDANGARSIRELGDVLKALIAVLRQAAEDDVLQRLWDVRAKVTQGARRLLEDHGAELRHGVRLEGDAPGQRARTR